MLKLAALGCAILTLFMGALHIMLSMGLPIGEYVLGGKNKIIPKEKRYINVIAAFVFLFLGVFYIGKAVPVPIQFPAIMSKIIMILYSLFLAYAIIGNTFFTKSKKEKIVMIPASVIGFMCSFFTLLLSW